LTNIIDVQDTKFEEIKNRVKKYEKEKGSEVLSLNNDIANLKAILEQVNDQQKELKDQAEEISAKKRGKISEFAQILMAINNIETKCLEMKATKIRHVVKEGKKPADFDNL
jgi:chromosome segregation ATPase